MSQTDSIAQRWQVRPAVRRPRSVIVFPEDDARHPEVQLCPPRGPPCSAHASHQLRRFQTPRRGCPSSTGTRAGGEGDNVQCVFPNGLRRASSFFPPNETRISTGTELHTSTTTRARRLRSRPQSITSNRMVRIHTVRETDVCSVISSVIGLAVLCGTPGIAARRKHGGLRTTSANDFC
jgi:hypothetical protein